MTIEERNTARAIQDIAKELKSIRRENDRIKIIDWEERRYEIAKDMLASNYEFFIRMYSGAKNITEIIMENVVYNADALIEELKKK